MKNIIPLIAVSFLLMGCSLHAELYDKSAFGPVEAEYELTKDDIFAVDDITSENISVFGVELGDQLTEVIARVGEPDRFINYEELGINLEYDERLGLEETGLLFHLDDGLVTRITIMKPLSDELVGSTDFDEYDKEDVYFELFGVPDTQDVFTFFRRFIYTDEGFEIFIGKKSRIVGFSLVPPGNAPERDINQTLVKEWEEKLE